MNQRPRTVLPTAAALLIFVLTLSFPVRAQDWLRSFNASGRAIDEAAALVPAGGGAVLAVGSSMDTASGWAAATRGWDASAVLYEQGGTERWRLVYDGGQGRDEKACCAGFDAAGNVYLAGCAFDSTNGWDILLLKADAGGRALWARRWGGARDERAVAMRTDMQGNSYLVGMGMSAAGISNLVVVKFDASGAVQWSTRFDTDQEIDPAAMEVDPWGNILVVGTRGRTATELFLVKYSFAGVLRWWRAVTGGTGSAEGAALAVDGVGNVFAAGSATVSNSSDALLVKFGSDGTVAWTQRYNGQGNDADAATAVAIDADGNSYLAVRSRGGASGVDMVTVKYAGNGSQAWTARHSGAGGAADRNPPLFGGASGATYASDGSAVVHWARAVDDQSPARALTYRVYLAISPGAYDFGTPLHTLRNAQSAPLTGLLRGNTYYVLVRATDEAGNTDANARELRVTVPPLPRRDLIVARDTVISHGMHLFDAVVVRAGAVLYCNGEVAIRAVDSIAVHGTVRSDCWPVELRCAGSLVVTGRIDNRCSDEDSARPGSIFLSSAEGKALLWSASPTSGIFSHGSVTVSDDSSFAAWKLAVLPPEESAVPLRPAAALTADLVHGAADTGATLPMRFRIAALDPDGGAVRCDIDFGDGTTQSNLPVTDIDALIVEKTYARPGVYLPQVTVRDEEGTTSVAALQLVVGDSASIASSRPGLQLSADRIAVARGDSAALEAGAVAAPGSRIDSIRWDFGDGATALGRAVRHAWPAPGVYHVTAHAYDDSARSSGAVLSLYVYEPDTTVFAAPPAQASGLVIIDLPMAAAKGCRLFFGQQDVTFYQNAALICGKGADGRSGRAASDGAGARVWSGGRLAASGVYFAAGDGGNGSGGGAASHGRAGGRGGELLLAAGDIALNGGRYASGNGGDGGIDSKVGAGGSAACALGGDGGTAGMLALHAFRGIALQAPSTLEPGHGGQGGDVIAVGGDGRNACPAAGNGGPAIARGGDGGRSSATPLLRGALTDAFYATVANGAGGKGGDATALGGAAGVATGCTASAAGGRGGSARASGGAGGNSGGQVYGLPLNAQPFACTGGPGGSATATAAAGGEAKSSGSPDPGMYGCPAQDGGDATASGGRGGDASAVRGDGGSSQRGDGAHGSSQASAGDGGDAQARGGRGGYGTGCNCAGGNGGSAAATAGLAGAIGAANVALAGRDGDADAVGGSGGEGGDCCSPFQPVDGGGPGGNGGSATSTAGPTGANAGKGGSAGEGGDGCPRRNAGLPGAGIGAPAAIAAGDSAMPGAPCCPIPARTFIQGGCSYIIAPGQGYSWDIYDSLQTRKLATMTTRFMSETEAGGMVVYSCSPIMQQITIQRGGLVFELQSLIDAVYPSRNWKCLSLRLEYTATDTGSVMMTGLRNSTISDQKHQSFTAGSGSVTVNAPDGTFFDSISVLFFGPVRIQWWGITAVFQGPQ